MQLGDPVPNAEPLLQHWSCGRNLDVVPKLGHTVGRRKAPSTACPIKTFNLGPQLQSWTPFPTLDFLLETWGRVRGPPSNPERGSHGKVSSRGTCLHCASLHWTGTPNSLKPQMQLRLLGLSRHCAKKGTAFTQVLKKCGKWLILLFSKTL